MDRREFIKVNAKTLKTYGFKRWDNNFSLKLSNGVTVLIWIHRSFFENGYYVEFAFSFKPLDIYSLRISQLDYYKMDVRCGRMKFDFGRANEIYYSEISSEDYSEAFKKNIEKILSIAMNGKNAIVDEYIKLEPRSRAILKDKRVAVFLGVENLSSVRYAK